MDHRSFVVRDATAASLNPSDRSTLTRIQFSTRFSKPKCMLHHLFDCPVMTNREHRQGILPGTGLRLLAVRWSDRLIDD